MTVNNLGPIGEYEELKNIQDTFSMVVDSKRNTVGFGRLQKDM